MNSVDDSGGFMTSRMTRSRIVIVVAAVLIISASVFVAVQLLGQSSSTDLKILVVTGEGLQETYGFFDVSHTSNTFNYNRDKFWTESTVRWTPSTSAANVSLDSSKKVRGDFSVFFDFDANYPSYFFFHRVSYPYGYLAQDGDKWLYFSLMFDKTAQLNDL